MEQIGKLKVLEQLFRIQFGISSGPVAIIVLIYKENKSVDGLVNVSLVPACSYISFFSQKHSWQYKQIRILLQELNLDTKLGLTQGNIDLL